MWLSAQFVVDIADPSYLANASLHVRAVADSPGASQRLNIRATECVLEVSGTSCRVPSVSASVPFDDSISVLDPLTISWEMSLDGRSWLDAGTSRSRVYITWATPLQDNPIETLLHVGSSAASGSMGVVGADDDRVLDAVW